MSDEKDEVQKVKGLYYVICCHECEESGYLVMRMVSAHRNKKDAELAKLEDSRSGGTSYKRYFILRDGYVLDIKNEINKFYYGSSDLEIDKLLEKLQPCEKGTLPPLAPKTPRKREKEMCEKDIIQIK